MRPACTRSSAYLTELASLTHMVGAVVWLCSHLRNNVALMVCRRLCQLAELELVHVVTSRVALRSQRCGGGGCSRRPGALCSAVSAYVCT